MANYHVTFVLNGETHSTTGESSYPSNYLVENNKVDYDILMDNAFIFIKKYMRDRGLSGQVNPRTVTFRYTL